MFCSVVQDPASISDIDEVIRTQLMDQSDQLTMPSIPHHTNANGPYVILLVQPASRNLRFRYECEGRSAGSIAGANSTQENKTYPTIQVINYQGPFVVVVSAVTKEGPPYRPHPHNLVGREGCKKGICTLVVNNQDMTYSFTSLGIQCVKRKDIEKSLQLRQHQKIDPFGTGFDHQRHPGSIDLNVVRLCFQVFIKGPDNLFSQPLPPIVSESIYDKKAMCGLTITKLSHFSAPVCGGKEVILLCDRVTKEDIQIWFYEEHGSVTTWESQAEFQPNDVHKQVAIVFRTPRYYNENIQQPVNVFIELRRPSDRQKGEPRSFQFRPMKRDPEGLAHKRLKTEDNYVSRYLHSNVLAAEQGMLPEHQAPIAVPRTMKQAVRQRIKMEPQPGTSGASNDSFPGVTVLGMPPQYTTMQTQDVSPLHLTPVHSPGLAMSPSGCSLASSVSPPLVLPPSSIGQGTVGPSMVSQALSPASQNLLTETEGNNPVKQAEQVMIEKFDSLDIDNIPSNELTDFNMNLNLSTSLFDSANNLMENALPVAPVTNSASTQEHNMLSEENLNHISKIQNDLDEFNKLTKN